MTEKVKKPKNKKEYQEAELSLLRGTLKVYACKKCGWPVINGYCCTTCGDSAPYDEIKPMKRKVNA